MRRILPWLTAPVLVTATLQAQTVNVDLVAASGFAASVAVVDDDILVARTGAEVRMATYPQAGGVYVFRQGATGAWAVADVLAPTSGAVGDQFGSGVAWLGETMVVGAPGARETRGVAYLFERTGTSWIERASLDPGAETRAGAGSAVAVTSDAVFLGAPGGLGDLAAFGQPAPPQPGVVYVYGRDAVGEWVLLQRLGSPEPGGSDRFGGSLLAVGDDLFVGAPGGRDDSGAVHHFQLSAGRWELRRSIALEDGVAGDRLGASLAGDATTLFAGAPGRAGRGAVAVFEHRDTGNLLQVLTAPGEPARAAFGSSITVGGGAVWVGAPFASQAAGAVYLFDRESLQHMQTLGAGELGPGAAFGTSLAAGESFAVIGAGQADLRLGAAAVLDWPSPAGGWRLASTLHDPRRTSMAAISGERITCEDGSAGDYACSDVDLVSFLPLEQLGAGPASIANDIWGWTDPLTGREYVLLGKSNGTSFVDISDPASPVYVGELPLTQGAQENLWRDVKTYANHAFIVADGAGAHGVQIFDLTQLRDVRDAPVTFEETAHYDGIFSAHNIVINEETGFAHAVGSSGGGEPCGGGLHMIDVRDPKSPLFAGCFADPSTGGFLGGGYTHDAQCVIYRGPDQDFVGREICLHASIDALGISDITDKENPVALARADYPGVVAAHQGWLTEDHRYFFMGDELDEDSGTVGNTRTLVWDVAELDDPILVTEYYADTRAIDHNQYIRGDYLYQSNLMSGLRILDVSDPENPREVAFFDTVPHDDDVTAFGGSWSNYPFFPSGVIAVSSWNEGLFILEKSEPALVP